MYAYLASRVLPPRSFPPLPLHVSAVDDRDTNTTRIQQNTTNIQTHNNDNNSIV